MNRDDGEIELLLRRMMQSEADAAEPAIATLTTPPRRTHRRFTVGLAVGLAAVVVAVLAFAFAGRTTGDTVVASDSTTSPKSSNKPSERPTLVELTNVETALRTHQESPLAAYGAPSGQFWIVAQTEGALNAVLFGPAGTRLGESERLPLQGLAGRDAPGAVDDQGNLWLTTSDALVEVSAADFAATRHSFASLPRQPGADAKLPPPLTGTQFPRAAVYDPSKDALVLAFSGSSRIAVYHIATDIVSTIDLPGWATSGVDHLVVTGDSSIVVSLTDSTGNLNTISAWNGTEWKRFTVSAAAYLVASGAESVYTGGRDVSRLDVTSGQQDQLADPELLNPPSPVGYRNGLAAVTRDGLAIIGADGGITVVIAPMGKCPQGMSFPMDPTSSSVPKVAQTCRMNLSIPFVARDQLLAANDGGRVFLVRP